MGVVTSRMEASINAMKEFYPSFSLSGSPIGTGPVAVWKGEVQPIRGLDNLEQLLDDIHHDRPVYVQLGGRVEHHYECIGGHHHHDWMGRLSNPLVSYRIALHYGGDIVHPRAYVLEPPLPLLRRKHVFADGAVCAYPAWEKVWQSDRDTVVDFMDHVLVWLIKWTVWLQAKVWIGSEMAHETDFLLRTIDPDWQCHCGSGKKYKDCHLNQDRRNTLLASGFSLNLRGTDLERLAA